jgi:hypothetical protein
MHTNGHHSSDSGFPALVEGVVEAANPKGVRVRGEWFNASQFKPVALPEVGEYVRLNVDAKRFISAVEVVKPAHDDGVATPAVLSDRDERIARLAVLKAAAEFGASRPDLKSADVLKIADAWLAWINS